LKEEEHSESEQPVPSTSSASDRIEEQPRESFIFRRPPVSVSEQGTNGKLSYNFDVKSERFTYLSCMLTGLPPLNLPVGVSGEETSNLDGGISTHEISVRRKQSSFEKIVSIVSFSDSDTLPSIKLILVKSKLTPTLRVLTQGS